MGIFSRKKKAETAGAPSLPSHVAFIMDGNGRWATARHLPREYGHRKGAETFRRLARHCFDLGIPYVTVYAFSTENWRRPAQEVEEIMRLLSRYIDEAADGSEQADASIVFIGRRDELAPELISKMEALEAATAGRAMRLRIALNYGGRDEIVRAVNRLRENPRSGAITEEELSAALDDPGVPDPDIVVRTGGDYRTSNFLLWQSAYAEYFFTKTLWPDLTNKEVDAIVSDFATRHRRFGGL